MRRALVLLLLCSITFAAKPRAWQDASVIAIETEDRGAAAVPIGGFIVAVPISHVFYRIEAAELIYVTRCDCDRLNVTVHGKNRIAIEGEKIYLIDDAGKEKKLRIVQKIAKVAQ